MQAVCIITSRFTWFKIATARNEHQGQSDTSICNKIVMTLRNITVTQRADRELHALFCRKVDIPNYPFVATLMNNYYLDAS
jgi:hypothetical protein